jgi:hypothetical protein
MAVVTVVRRSRQGVTDRLPAWRGRALRWLTFVAMVTGAGRWLSPTRSRFRFGVGSASGLRSSVYRVWTAKHSALSGRQKLCSGERLRTFLKYWLKGGCIQYRGVARL